MFQASFTVTPTAGSVLATEFTVTNLTSGASVLQYTWDFGLGDLIYNTANPKKIYNHPGNYTITLTAVNFDGQTSTHSQQVTAELEYRDYVRFTQIPEKFPDPGVLTDVPFKFEVVSSNPDKPLVVDLFSSNSKSTPYQYTADRWEFLTPVWKFLDTNQKPIDKLILTPTPMHKNNVVVAVSGTGEFFYVDSTSTGDPTTNCPILLTVTLQTSGFSNPLDSSVFPYESFSNNQTVRTGVIWQVNDLSPTLLKVSSNYIEGVEPSQWMNVKTPILITAHSNRSQIIPGSTDAVSEVIFSYPSSNNVGKQSPVTLTLTNLLSEQYSIDEAPLHFQKTDVKNLQAGGYIFTTITGLTAAATSIIAQTTAFTNRLQPDNEFTYPLGFGPNTSVWISNPEKNTLNKITLVPDPGTCNTINYFKDNGILTDGIIKQVSVPFSTSDNTFNYEMSGFSGIYGMAIDPRNYDLIAADAELDRLYRFSNTGTLLNTFELSSINDYDPKKKMFEHWTWRTPAPSLSSTRFTFYRPTPLSPKIENYIVQAGGVILPPDSIQIDEHQGTIRILVQPLKCGVNFIDQKQNFQAGLCSENFNEDMYFAPDLDINVIQIFNPVLPTIHISSIMCWTSASYEPSTSFPLTTNISLLTDSNYYIVSIDGVVQRPSSYTIDNVVKNITFEELVPSNTTVNVVYLPTIQPPTNWTQTFNTETSSFHLTGSSNQQNYLQDPHASFLVNVGGVFQDPKTFIYNIEKQQLTFSCTIPSDVPVSVTQLTVAENIDAVAAFTPAHVSLDKNYNIWVSLFNSVSVLKFDPEFNFLFSVAPTGINWPKRSWTVSPPEDISYQAARFSDTSRMFDASSADTLDIYTNEFLLKPPVAETDKENNCWVTYANPLCCLLVKYSESGQPLLQIPLKQYSVPINVAVNVQNNVWVSNFHGSSYKNTPLSGSIELYNTTSGELLKTVTNISRPGHMALDRQNNLWFTHGLRRFGYFNTATDTLCSWVLDSSGNITEFVLPSAFDVTALESFDEFDNREDDELGGLAVDVYNRVWILDNTHNFAYVLTASPDFVSYPIRSFKIIPDITLGYYIDLNTGSTYAQEGDHIFRSAQATGDWTGNRWYQKYTNVQTITATPVSGISAPFVFTPFANKHQIRRVNESFNAAEYYKSLALPEILNSNTVLFDNFLPAVIGNSEPSMNEDVGQITYEKISNFVLNHSDIDTCNIDQLLSLAELTDNSAFDYAATYPLDIKNMLNIASVPRSQLWGLADNAPLLNRSLGAEYNTQTDFLTAGTSIILKNKADSSLSLLQVPPLPTGEIVYTLNNFSGFGLINPTFSHIFYRFVPAYSDSFIENIIDWDSPHTTQTKTASTSEEWYGDNGAIETAFRYLLINNLFPK